MFKKFLFGLWILSELTTKIKYYKIKTKSNPYFCLQPTEYYLYRCKSLLILQNITLFI